MLYLALLAGIPANIATTYARYHSELTIHNIVAGGMGKGCRRQRGIPQGCPFSQRFCAVLLRPWIALARAHSAVPRCLADDLHLYVVGQDVYDRFHDALMDTHRFVLTIGGKIAPKKNALCSNRPELRRRLKQQHWPLLDGPIPVRLAFRDLGAHFSSGARRWAGTGRQRIRNASAVAHAVRKLPTSGDIRARLLGGKAIPMGHYATEMTPCNGRRSALLPHRTHGGPYRAPPCHARTGAHLSRVRLPAPRPAHQPPAAQRRHAAAHAGGRRRGSRYNPRPA